jgi:hypothetical protein
MNAADVEELSEVEKVHFYQCKECGEMVDKRQLDDVLFHEDHVQRPDIQYGGTRHLGESHGHNHSMKPTASHGRVSVVYPFLVRPMFAAVESAHRRNLPVIKQDRLAESNQKIKVIGF